MPALCPHCKAPLPEVVDAFCPECRGPLDELQRPSEAITAAGWATRPPGVRGRRDELAFEQLDELEARVEALELRLQQSNLYSPNFMTRAFAVWGHHFVAHLLIALPFFILGMCLGLFSR